MSSLNPLQAAPPETTPEPVATLQSPSTPEPVATLQSPSTPEPQPTPITDDRTGDVMIKFTH